MKKRRADISRNQWEPCSQSFADNLLTPYNNHIMWSPNQILCRMHYGAVESWKVALSWNQILDFLTRWHTLKNLILCYRHHNYITFYCFWYPHLQAKTQAHISKVLLDEWRPRLPFPQAKPSAAWWHLLSFHSYPHKLPALRLNTWHRTLREISFVVSGTISSTFKWHQTGGSLFQAYKWRHVQVLHLIHRQSQIADRPRTEFSKWFIMFFYSLFKWLASLISLRPGGFKSPLLLKT